MKKTEIVIKTMENVVSHPVSYHFDKFPPESLNWQCLIPLVGAANAALARYDGLLSAIPNADLLLSPLLLHEAVLSSKIEGTQVTVGEVLEIEADGESTTFTQPKRDDAEEVLNYREALYFCARAIDTRGLTQSLMREAHARLMRGVRGSDKTPGAYRNDQNWIGPKGCTAETASFVPIAPEHLQSSMDKWENFLKGTYSDPLIQLAITHLEFEALHPFRDGNGRMGRMLIPLFLYYHKLLSSPNFYMSGYLETHRDEYQERMRAVSREDLWTDWIVFFLNGIAEQAKDNEKRARGILSFYDEVKDEMVELTHSQHAIRAVDFLFRRPVFRMPDFIKHSEIPKPTAVRIINILKENNLISTIREGRGRRSSLHAFVKLLLIAEGHDVVSHV